MASTLLLQLNFANEPPGPSKRHIYYELMSKRNDRVTEGNMAKVDEPNAAPQRLARMT